MTIKDALKNAYQKNPNLDKIDINILLVLALHKKIEYIHTNTEKELTASSYKKFHHLLRKKNTGYSIAYLQGYKYFYGYKFLVNKHTLIPRPDSEIIIDEVLKIIKPNDNVIDIGTGSGCLISSIVKDRPSGSPKADPEGRFTACDISKKALGIAKTNARKLKLKNNINFIHSNLLKNINPNTKFDIIIANLPYLTPEQMKEPSIKKEPSSALLSGQDGLDHYRKLLKHTPQYLNKKYNIFLEIDPNQESAIKKIISESLPQAKIEFIKDLAQNIRVVKITN